MRQKHQIVAALRNQLGGGNGRPPEGSIPLWNAFGLLSRQRAWGANGPNPISLEAIDAYCRLMRQPLEPHHVEVILEMDRVWLDHVQAGIQETLGGKNITRKPSSPLTTAAFDAFMGSPPQAATPAPFAPSGLSVTLNEAGRRVGSNSPGFPRR